MSAKTFALVFSTCQEKFEVNKKGAKSAGKLGDKRSGLDRPRWKTGVRLGKIRYD